ncbi:Zn-ribbon domain-containing OB-fold protein [Piscinibacter sp. XHJ-5]|uniref:Zn-ribbon domain-containing OB-fold protein n=1 Tax=Piscinibacter sp. XHJ-5 TaxID=3037797 RepID=UPI002453304A|nr:Zn-ribbon domain-containing OB-fold protein [Piscinibacter sp. XHJ-5]
MTMIPERPLPAPIVDVFTAPFWQAASEGVLLIRRCKACGEAHWYPRPFCPHCASDDTQWVPASGRGTIYSFTVARKAGPVPYVLAYVTLDEGVTMLTNLVDGEVEALHIGQRVQVTFRAGEGGAAIAVFTPCTTP